MCSGSDLSASPRALGESQASACSEEPPSPLVGSSNQKGNEAFEAVMKKQVSRLALTLSHTLITKEALSSFLAPYCDYIRVGHELHKHSIEGHPDDHLHAFLQLKSQKRLGQLYKLVSDQFLNSFYGRPDLRQLATNTDAAKWNNYVKKEGDFLDFGILKTSGAQPKGSLSQATYDDDLYKEFLTIAKADGVELALAFAASQLPREYCTRLKQLREAAESVIPPRPKYTAPCMDSKSVTLRAWQKYFIKRLMDHSPKRRRIHWVRASPGKGKSFVHDYLCANHPMGVFNCTDRCGINDLAYQYDEEGVAMWDFPLNFDWDTMESTACSVIEKFSDFGSKLRSLKYSGKNSTALCHVVIFSNRSCPAGLLHRDVVEFDVDDFDLQQQAAIDAAIPIPLVPLSCSSDLDRSIPDIDYNYVPPGGWAPIKFF